MAIIRTEQIDEELHQLVVDGHKISTNAVTLFESGRTIDTDLIKEEIDSINEFLQSNKGVLGE